MVAETLLASWRDTATRAAIVDFVRRATAEGTPESVVPGERVAVFDNDGTLWSGKPNAQSIQDGIESLLTASAQPVGAVVIDLDANDELDITTSEKLAKLVRDLRQIPVRVGFAHFHAPALDMARRAGVLDEMEATPVFETVAQAVVWATSAGPDRPGPARTPNCC